MNVRKSVDIRIHKGNHTQFNVILIFQGIEKKAIAVFSLELPLRNIAMISVQIDLLPICFNNYFY
jgi:hypothetical protein